MPRHTIDEPENIGQFNPKGRMKMDNRNNQNSFPGNQKNCPDSQNSKNSQNNSQNKNRNNNAQQKKDKKEEF